MAVTLMFEAKAADGRGPELLAWARAQRFTGQAPERRETLTAPGGRVLVITWWPAAYDAPVPELPDPPPHLLARPAHRWRFEPVD